MRVQMESFRINEVLVQASLDPEGVITAPRISSATVKIHNIHYKHLPPMSITDFGNKLRNDIVKDVLLQAGRNISNLGSIVADVFTRRATRLAREEDAAMQHDDDEHMRPQ